jgi:hypothetical protein
VSVRRVFTREYWTADTTAGAVRAVAAAAQIATGPAAALAIAAASEATVAAVASYVAVRALGDTPAHRRRHALAYVVARVEREELCSPLLADAWLFAIGATRPAARRAWVTSAARLAAGAAASRAVRKLAFAKLLKVVSIAEVVRMPERARKARELVGRARHHARVFAETAASEP